MIPQLSTARWIGLGLGLLFILGCIYTALSWRAERNELREWRDDIVTIVRAEIPIDRRKSVSAKTAADEIRWLGREYRTHSEALRIQSERLFAAGKKVEGAQNDATASNRRAAENDKPRAAVRTRLNDPKRQGGLDQAVWEQL